MDVAIIDADLIANIKSHRFPNLASMKISGYYKRIGCNVILKLDYNNLQIYDKVFISKVFTDTKVSDDILSMENVEYGGTGFFYDLAIPLDYDIEHCMPDYNLYDEWVNDRLLSGENRKNLVYYIDYSIGYITRGCIRGCEFCVNKNSKEVIKNSEINEFLRIDRKKICLLDDNIFAYKYWEDVFEKLKNTKCKFQFKQGLDIRLLTDEKAKILAELKYDGDYIFAFDNIKDRKVIIDKLDIWKKHNLTKGQNTKLYLFCAFDESGIYDEEFWIKDIREVFERIYILMLYNAKPYIMRYEEYRNSPYYGIYVNLAYWCNQPSLFSNHSYEELCYKDNLRKGGESATKRYNEYFLQNEFNRETYDIYCKIRQVDVKYK